MENQARDYGQENFTLPHDMVPLPSQGAFYKNKKKALKVGYLTASDENILMGGADDITATLLRSKIYEPDVRIDDLLEGDIEAILVFLRNTSFGPEMEIALKDPQTEKEFLTKVLLDELNIVKGQQPNEEGLLVTTLPVSAGEVKLKPLTYGESQDLKKVLDSYPQGRVAPRVTMRLSKEIHSINGNTQG